jgi:hypothetical protein
MAVINRIRKFVYLCEPHTASRSTVEALIKYVPGSEDLQPHQRFLERQDWLAYVKRFNYGSDWEDQVKKGTREKDSR